MQRTLRHPRPLTPWESTTAVDGAWDRKRRWKDPTYLAASPYSRADHARGAATLQHIFPRELVRKELRDAQKRNAFSWLTPVLCDPFRPDVSSLVLFGLDAADARVERYTALVANLRSPHHADFRAEVEFLAGLERGRIPHEPYEPRARNIVSIPGTRQGNPDFRARFGAWVTLDVKHMRMAQRAVDALERIHTVLHGPNMSSPIGLSVEFLPRFTDMERSVDSRRFAEFCVELNRSACAKAAQMRADRLPECVVDDVLRLRLLDPSFAYPGPTIEHPDDARRATHRLDEGAEQVAPDLGFVVLVPDLTINAGHLLAVAREWLRGPADHVLGVVVIHDVHFEHLGVAMRMPSIVWRNGVRGAAARVQRDVRGSRSWRRFYMGLNARRWQLALWRRRSFVRDGT
jgi:hypothetical protein